MFQETVDTHLGITQNGDFVSSSAEPFLNFPHTTIQFHRVKGKGVHLDVGRGRNVFLEAGLYAEIKFSRNDMSHLRELSEENIQHAVMARLCSGQMATFEGYKFVDMVHFYSVDVGENLIGRRLFVRIVPVSAAYSEQLFPDPYDTVTTGIISNN